MEKKTDYLLDLKLDNYVDDINKETEKKRAEKIKKFMYNETKQIHKKTGICKKRYAK